MARSPRRTVNTVVRFPRATGYRWTEQDEDMEFVCSLLDKSPMSHQEIREKMLKLTGGSYGIAVSTMHNWEKGKTRRPQNQTMKWVAYTLGYVREWREV